MQGFYHLREGVDDLVLRVESRLHFGTEITQAALEIVEGFVVELLVVFSLGGELVSGILL